MEITFLGTGLPVPDAKRCGQGILISHDETKILIDCGPGVNRRLIEAEVAHNDINHIIFTHLHWDHFGDYDAFVQTSFITDRKIPLQVYGPPGIQEITDLLFHKVYNRDLVYRRGTRKADSWRDPEVKEIFGQDQWEIGPFKIKAFRVHHGEFVDYSLSFRIECGGKSVVISSDTAPVLGFAKHARDTDLLIHEVFPGKPPSKNIREAHPHLSDEEIVNMMGHCSPRQVGEIAHESNAKKLMLIHLGKNLPEDLVDQIAEHYDGSIEISEDLMEIEV